MASSGHDNTAHAALERRWMLQDAGCAAALLLATDTSCFEMKAGIFFVCLTGDQNSTLCLCRVFFHPSSFDVYHQDI